MTEFRTLLNRLLSDFYYQELLGLDENGHPREQMTGLKEFLTNDNFVMDEMLSWAWEKPEPVKFTPVQFNRMWSSWSRDKRVGYVRALITN